MENQFVVVHFQVYWPMILKLERERRTAPGDVNVFRYNLDAQVIRFLNDLFTQHLRTLSICYRESYFLVDVIVELESRKVGRAVLGPGEKKGNQHEQNENLPAAQAKHSAELYTVATVGIVQGLSRINCSGAL